jgi:hypothetical protein
VGHGYTIGGQVKREMIAGQGKYILLMIQIGSTTTYVLTINMNFP